MARVPGGILCACLLPCVMIAHLCIYIVVSICVTISYSPAEHPVLFISPGASSNTTKLAAHPRNPFWSLRLEDGALWNRLQHPRDRRHNPILSGNRTRRRGERMQALEGRAHGGSNACRPDQHRITQLHDFHSLPEQMRDFILSMHCSDFPRLMEPSGICSGEEGVPMLLLAIKSQVGNFENRQAIRQTWGRSGWMNREGGSGGGLVRTVFLLGKQDGSTGHYPDLSALLELENQRHHDILQWDFRDTFFNLTLKDVMFWRWFSARCSHARFIFKGDDDIFLRTQSLLDFLHEQEMQDVEQNATTRTRDFFVGDVINNAGPHRQPFTKYYIPESFYRGVYPPYAGGGGVVYSGTLALRLKLVSEWVHLFPIDDVYVGMCLQRLGISPDHHPGFLTFDLPETEREKPCAYRSIFLVHKRSPREMLKLWSELQTPPAC